MSLRRSAAIAKNELRIVRNDPAFVVIFTLMAIALMAFVKPAFKVALVASGLHNANGAEQAVPGQAVMFAFFMVGFVGFSVFREHGWATWDRLRASQALPAEIMAGKMAVPLLILALQLSVEFGIGTLLFGLRIHGSIVGLVAIAIALALCVVCLGLALLSICRTLNQLNAIANVGAIVFAGLGGALVPISLEPWLAQRLAPATPSYWAMRGFRSVIERPDGIASVALPIGVLLAFAIGFAFVAARCFRFEEPKIVA